MIELLALLVILVVGAWVMDGREGVIRVGLLLLFLLVALVVGRFIWRAV